MVALQQLTVLFDVAHSIVNCLQSICWRFYKKLCDRQFLYSAKKRLLAATILDNCQDCKKMASIPQGAFATCKLRELYRDRELMISRMNSANDKTNEPKDKPQNKKLLEYTPVKYNGKLMNSIWGLYNRYSPHNIKGNEYEYKSQDNNKQQH